MADAVQAAQTAQATETAPQSTWRQAASELISNAMAYLTAIELSEESMFTYMRARRAAYALGQLISVIEEEYGQCRSD